MAEQTRAQIEAECARAVAAALAVYARDSIVRPKVAAAEYQYCLALAKARRRRKLAALEHGPGGWKRTR